MRTESALGGALEHGAKVVVLGTIDRLIIQSVIAWDGVCATTPEQGDQIEPPNEPMALA
jgi:hypothetical protein